MKDITVTRLVAVGAVTVAAALLVLPDRNPAPETDPAAAVAVAIDASLEDYRPYDVMQTPEEYDASRAECWDRNQTLTAALHQAYLKYDSLESEYYAARVRIAELEGQ